MNKLEVRSLIKSKKPDFIRQKCGTVKRVSGGWRKPKGLHSKMRSCFKGHRRMVSPGWRSPAEARGLHRSGLQPIIVNSEKDMADIKKETQGAIIAKQVGLKKKIILAQKAKKMGIRILNIKDVDGFLKTAEEKIRLRKESKKKGIDEKSMKAKEAEKKAKEKTELTEKVSEEEKKEQEKKEKDKLLTKKGV